MRWVCCTGKIRLWVVQLMFHIWLHICYICKIHICLPIYHKWITIYETYMFLFSWDILYVAYMWHVCWIYLAYICICQIYGCMYICSSLDQYGTYLAQYMVYVGHIWLHICLQLHICHVSIYGYVGFILLLYSSIFLYLSSAGGKMSFETHFFITRVFIKHRQTHMTTDYPTWRSIYR